MMPLHHVIKRGQVRKNLPPSFYISFFLRNFATMKRLIGYFILFLALCCCTTEGERTKMRAGLDSINVLNRNDKPFTVQDVEPYIQFFDEHGTPNDRLLAHYLHGRAYYEQGEAPMALKCFHDAIECADTTSKDCDFAQLSRVYGQMGGVFYYQGLYHEQIKCNEKAEEYAWLAKDTIHALIYYELKGIAYDELGMIDSAIYVIENVAHQYAQYGYQADSVIALGSLLRTLIQKADLMKAKQYMDAYEAKSGLFDENHNIEAGREYYYRVKGNYYLLTGLLDSAEYFFRKELRDGKDFNNQNAGAKGLAKIYEILNKPDSAAKYYEYSYSMNDSLYAQQATETIKRISSMYDYSRHMENARLEKQKATTRLVYIWISAIVILLLTTILIVIVLYLQYIRQKRKGIEREYQHSLMVIEQAHRDLKQLQEFKDQNKRLISEKEQLIHEQDVIRKEILRKEKAGQEFALRQFKTTAIYTKFCKLAITGRQPSETEWTLLQDAIFNAYPNFSELMTTHCQDLDEREYRVCLLIRADFKPNSISSMLAILPSVITQLRTGLNLKLFGRRGTSKEFDSLLRKIY